MGCWAETHLAVIILPAPATPSLRPIPHRLALGVIWILRSHLSQEVLQGLAEGLQTLHSARKAGLAAVLHLHVYQQLHCWPVARAHAIM